MIFIAVNLLPINSFTKVSLLLFFAAFSYIITYFSHPFVFDELNDIELNSLMSAMITLFSGALYLCDVGDYIKALSFSAIIFVNSCFSLGWAFHLFNGVFDANFAKLQKIFPYFTHKLFACILSFQITEQSWNLRMYLKNFQKNYNEAKKEIIQTYENKNSKAKKVNKIQI